MDFKLAQKTASTFKKATCTPDGVHPRHFSLLSPRGLEALSWILWTIDALGQCPEQIQEVQVPLYTKPDSGGLRPIGFFRALFRLWGKTKKPLVRAWELSRGNHAAFSMSPGVSAIDPVWRQSIRAEHHSGVGDSFVALLWDIKKCYEHVRHNLLWEEARFLAFPLVVIRCSLAAYSWPRVLLLECAAAAPLFPRRGIVAGSFAATSELKCYMYRAIAEYCIVFPPPAYHLSIHVDDSGLDITRPNDEACFCDAIEAAEPLISLFEDRLLLPLAVAKATVCASTDSLAVRVARALGPYGGSASYSVRNLGILVSAGKRTARKSHHMIKKLWLKFAAKLKRIARIKGKGRV